VRAGRAETSVGVVRTGPVAIAAACALVVASCGAESEEAERIEVAAVWTGDEQESFQNVLDAFTEESGVEVTYSPTGDDPSAILGTRAQGGDPPDVAIIPQPGLMMDLAIRDLLQPLDEDTVAVVEDNYDQEWIDLGMVDDELYGVFFKAANKSLVWFNAELFDQAGVSPPETWEELMEVAETFDRYGVPAFSVAGADGWVLTDWFENIYLQIAGPDRYRELAEGEVGWDDPTVVEALEHLAEIFQSERLAGGTDRTLLTDFPTAATLPFLDEPEAAMFFEGDFTAGVIADATDAEPGEGADFFPFPRIDQEETTVIGAGDMAILMTDSDPARELIRFLATPDAAAIWAEEGGFLSPNRNLEPDAYGDDQIAIETAEMLHDAELAFDLSDRQPAEFGATIGRGMFRILEDFLQHPDQVDEAAEELDREAEKAWRRLEEGRS
jgi:alpha-glucoside transport system substrate-binding protein